MKPILIFFTISLPSLLFGQIINHFNHLDSRWNVAKTFTAATQEHPFFAATTTTIFGFQGDTLINNKQWYKIFSTNDSLFQSNLIYRGLLRTENKLILYRDTSNQVDTLYDFNLKLGDSVLFNIYGLFPERLAVIKIDSIQLNGKQYKRFQFEEPSMSAFDWLNEAWIEGIGSIHGPLFPHSPRKFSEEVRDSMFLTCSYSDKQQIWQHPSYSKCYVNIVLGLQKKELLKFKIYPNPFSNKISLENTNSESQRPSGLNLTILNSIGQPVKQIKVTSNKQTIDLSELNDGVYLLKINDQKSTATMKIIKKH